MKKIIFLSFMALFACFVTAQWKPSKGPCLGNIYCLEVKGDTIFAGGPAGVFVSLNKGLNWESANKGFSPGTNLLQLFCNQKTVYAGGFYGIHISTDNGKNWKESGNGLSYSYHIKAFAAIGNKVFAGTEKGGVYVSENNGLSWTKTNAGISSEKIRCLASNGKIVYAGTADEGLFVSKDNGVNWTPINGITAKSISAIACKDNIIYAGSGPDEYYTTKGGEIFCSSDNGTNWKLVKPAGPMSPTGSSIGIEALAIHEDIVFAGTYSGLLCSSDEGKTWIVKQEGISTQAVTLLKTSGQTIYAGTDEGIFSSINKGAGWTVKSDGISNASIYSLGGKGNIVYAATKKGLYESADGENWKHVEQLNPQGEGIEFIQIKDGKMIAANLSDVYSSDDDAKTWSLLSNGAAVFGGITGVLLADSMILIGAENQTGIFILKKKNSKWMPSNKGITNKDIKSVQQIGKNIYAGTNDGIYVSGDCAKTWAAVNNGLKNYTYTNCFAGIGTRVFAGTMAYGVFVSDNDGKNWITKNNGLPDATVNSLLTAGNTIFAATDKGIFYSNDKGENWTGYNDGLFDSEINCIYVKENSIYVGTKDGGVWSRNLPR